VHEFIFEKPVSYSGAYAAFKKLLKMFKFEPSRFGLHSLRAGGTTDAFEHAVPPHLIDLHGRWKSSNSKYAYLRPSLSKRLSYFENVVNY
jgi:hypothetical protein